MKKLKELLIHIGFGIIIGSILCALLWGVFSIGNGTIDAANWDFASCVLYILLSIVAIILSIVFVITFYIEEVM